MNERSIFFFANTLIMTMYFLGIMKLGTIMSLLL